MPDYGKDCPCCGTSNPGAVMAHDGFDLECCGAFDVAGSEHVICPDGSEVSDTLEENDE